MSREQVTLYRSTCDACGDVEDSETDEVPDGWTEDGDETFCPPHSEPSRERTSG